MAIACLCLATTAASARSRPRTPVALPAQTQRLCEPGSSSNPLHVLKVTVSCLLSTQAFRDPDLKVKDRCVAKVGFDAATDLIPAAKVAVLDRESAPIVRSSKDLAAALKTIKANENLRVDRGLITTLDGLGKAVIILKHNPRELVQEFLVSDEALSSLVQKLRGHPDVITKATRVQGLMKKLFLDLTGISDVRQCHIAFRRSAPPAPKSVSVNCLPGGAGLQPKPFSPHVAPASCVLQGQPEFGYNLIPLVGMHWKNWGRPTTTGRGRLQSTHPGQGGPASSPIDVVLSRIKSGCAGRKIYTRFGLGVPGKALKPPNRVLLASCSAPPIPLP